MIPVFAQLSRTYPQDYDGREPNRIYNNGHDLQLGLAGRTFFDAFDDGVFEEDETFELRLRSIYPRPHNYDSVITVTLYDNDGKFGS